MCLAQWAFHHNRKAATEDRIKYARSQIPDVNLSATPDSFQIVTNIKLRKKIHPLKSNLSPISKVLNPILHVVSWIADIFYLVLACYYSDR